MSNKRKLAILDVDGTLLNHTSAFRQWCIEQKGLEWVESHEYDLMTYLPNVNCNNEIQNLVNEFNESLLFGTLYPTPYARAFIEELLEQDYMLSVMSSFITPKELPSQMHLRTHNLEKWFNCIFEYYDYLPLGSSKKELVRLYCENFDEVLFVDDNPKIIEEVMQVKETHGNLTVKVWDQSYNKDVVCDGRIDTKYFIEEE